MQLNHDGSNAVIFFPSAILGMLVALTLKEEGSCFYFLKIKSNSEKKSAWMYECNICLTPICMFTQTVWKCRQCNCILHTMCYRKWCYYSQTCPLCRQEQETCKLLHIAFSLCFVIIFIQIAVFFCVDNTLELEIVLSRN